MLPPVSGGFRQTGLATSCCGTGEELRREQETAQTEASFQIFWLCREFILRDKLTHPGHQAGGAWVWSPHGVTGSRVKLAFYPISLLLKPVHSWRQPRPHKDVSGRSLQLAVAIC